MIMPKTLGELFTQVIQTLPTNDSVVHDIQVDSTSILNNGVANIPIATVNNSSGYRLVQVDANNGINIASDNCLSIIRAIESDAKAANNAYRVCTPYWQHCYTFYGLAKAAGDSTQAASNNAVGVYTDDAKVKIQKMLGIYEPPYELVNDITLQEETDLELTTTDENVAYNFRNVFIVVEYSADLASATTGFGRYKFYDANNVSVGAETGKYQTSNQNNFKCIQTKREGNMTIANYTSQTTTGSGAFWKVKNIGNGIQFNLGNITKIDTFSDVEPAGARIRIYAQWAY